MPSSTLAIHSSSTAIKTSAGVVTSLVSNTFSPPAGSVIFVYVDLDVGSSGITVSGLTDSLGAHLAWAKRVSVASFDTDSEIWWAYCPSAQSNMTVTASITSTGARVNITCLVFTGADSRQNGAVGSAQSLTGLPSASLVTTRDGSWVIGTVTDFSNNDVPTIPSGQTDVYNGNTLRISFDTGGESGWVQGTSAPTPTAGTNVTINDTALSVSGSTAEWSIAIAEVLPALGLRSTVGSLSCPASTGNQAITGVGFQPKAILFWANLETANAGHAIAGTLQTMPMMLLGMTDGTAQAVVCDSDDFSGGDPHLDQTHCILIRNGSTSGGIDIQATIVSLDADGFTINWSNVVSGVVVNYLCLGGGDLTGCKIISGSMGLSATNVAFTGAGFQPDALVLIGGVAISAFGTGLATAGVGVVSGTTARGAASSTFNNATDTNTGVTLGGSAGSGAYQRTDKAYVEICGTNVPVKRYEADLASMDSGGFTLSLTTAPSATASTLFALCLKGASFKAGSFTQKTSTGSQQTTGIGFRPAAVMFFSNELAAAGSPAVQPINHMTGVTDGVNQGVVAKNSGVTNAADVLSRSNVLEMLTSSSATFATDHVAEAAITTLDADGFTVNWGIADATAREILYLALGPAPTSITVPMAPRQPMLAPGLRGPSR